MKRSQIRGLIIDYASKIKKKNQQKEMSLKKQIESLEKLEHVNVNDVEWADGLKSV